MPGIAEIAAVRERKPIVCRFDFLDGNKKAMYIDSQTTSKEVFGILAEKIGLKDPVGYAIYECYNNLERSLNESDNLSDALAKFERFENDCKAKNIKVLSALSDVLSYNTPPTHTRYPNTLLGFVPVPLQAQAATRAPSDEQRLCRELAHVLPGHARDLCWYGA